ncbi:MAG: ethylbenzene dehydrogenase-related protein [Thermodesulfobacteriota bacterium]
MKKNLSMYLVGFFLFILSVSLFNVPEGIAAAKQTLTAANAKSAPAGIDDQVWSTAKGIEVPFEGKEQFAGKKASVITKAVYTGDSIFFLFQWADPTLSVTKEAWKYDGLKWSHLQGNEDRISLLFEINRINNFATKGCAVTCHVPQGAPSAKDGKFGTSSEAEKGDLWHWKAARSDPAGFADDTWLTKTDLKNSGRKNDNGKGGDKSNMTDDKAKPKYMLAPGKELAKNNILLASHAVEISNYSVFKAGDIITYRMPNMPEGSRADIKAVSRWVNGQWTVLLSRKLDTGNDDDVAFNPKKSYNFAMALFDDSGDENSYDSETISLEFSR